MLGERYLRVMHGFERKPGIIVCSQVVAKGMLFNCSTKFHSTLLKGNKEKVLEPELPPTFSFEVLFQAF